MQSLAHSFYIKPGIDMIVGIGFIEIYIHESRSLKDKRAVLRSMLKRTKNEFNISIAEVGENDDWKRGKIGFCTVGNDRSYINSKIDKILKFIDSLYLAEVISTKLEIINYSELSGTEGVSEIGNKEG